MTSGRRAAPHLVRRQQLPDPPRLRPRRQQSQTARRHRRSRHPKHLTPRLAKERPPSTARVFPSTSRDSTMRSWSQAEASRRRSRVLHPTELDLPAGIDAGSHRLVLKGNPITGQGIVVGAGCTEERSLRPRCVSRSSHSRSCSVACSSPEPLSISRPRSNLTARRCRLPPPHAAATISTSAVLKPALMRPSVRVLRSIVALSGPTSHSVLSQNHSMTRIQRAGVPLPRFAALSRLDRSPAETTPCDPHRRSSSLLWSRPPQS